MLIIIIDRQSKVDRKQDNPEHGFALHANFLVPDVDCSVVCASQLLSVVCCIIAVAKDITCKAKEVLKPIPLRYYNQDDRYYNQ